MLFRSSLVTDRDLRGLRALREEGLLARYAVVSLDPVRRTVDNIEIWPWRDFLCALWDGSLGLGPLGPDTVTTTRE